MTAIWISVWKRCQHPHIMGKKNPKPVVSWLPAAAAICLDGTFLLLAWLEWFTRTLWVPGSNSWKRAGCISHHGLCFFLSGALILHDCNSIASILALPTFVWYLSKSRRRDEGNYLCVILPRCSEYLKIYSMGQSKCL